ncbi:MAG TPA: cytochrome c oxidase subunit 3 [Candidatus Angelobacter sp.]
MSITSERVDVKHKPKLGGGGPGKIPYRRGYGGGGDDGDHGRPEDFFSSGQRLRRGRIGIAAGIVCVTALFIGLTVVYVARLGTPHWDEALHREVYGWKPLALPYGLLWVNSTLLVLSSVALELARRSMLEKSEFATMGIRPPRLKLDPPWLAITVVLGFGFLAGQLWVWNGFRSQGLFLRGNPSSSLFYLITGLHAAHLAGGLIVLLYTACGSWLRMRFESQRIAVEITSWYWHFVGVLWFGIFALLHFAKG